MEFDPPTRDLMIAKYLNSLALVREMLEKRRALNWAEVMQNWTAQLSSPINDEDLSKHAERTIRALGGMRLRSGETYFAVLFVDDRGLIPNPEDGPRQKKIPHSSREHAKSGEYVPKETSS